MSLQTWGYRYFVFVIEELTWKAVVVQSYEPDKKKFYQNLDNTLYWIATKNNHLESDCDIFLSYCSCFLALALFVWFLCASESAIFIYILIFSDQSKQWVQRAIWDPVLLSQTPWCPPTLTPGCTLQIASHHSSHGWFNKHLFAKGRDGNWSLKISSICES